MTQEDYESLMDKLDSVYEETQMARKAIEYLEDHTQDNNLMANLGLIRRQISRTEAQLDDLMGRPAHHAISEDVPFD